MAVQKIGNPETVHLLHYVEVYIKNEKVKDNVE